MVAFDRAHSPLIGVTNNGSPELLEDLAEYHDRMANTFRSGAAAQRERARSKETSDDNRNARLRSIRAGVELLRAYVQSMDYEIALIVSNEYGKISARQVSRVVNDGKRYLNRG